MQVILKERVMKLGQIGDVVTVKPGYARNYLLPQDKAMRASKQNIAYFEKQRAALETENKEKHAAAEQQAKTIDGASVIVIRQAGDSGQLYGSVTSRDIAEGLAAQGHKVLRQQIIMGQPVKELGLYDFRVQLHPDVEANIVVNVAKTEDEAKAQADAAKAEKEAPKKSEDEAAPFVASEDDAEDASDA